MSLIKPCKHLIRAHRGTLSSLAAALLLAACASTPSPQAPEPQAKPTPPGKPSEPPKVVQKRGGGYYKDDGPGDEIPDNLDSIPDAEPRAEPLHRFANNPYNVFGKEYIPRGEIAPYREQGLASWYGKKFHGKRTSSGEPYDMFGMTAAHPTLPIPSYARVTNLGNSKSVIVRINDRGPFHPGRSIDLSYAAAHKLGYISVGHTMVEIESIVPEGVQVLAANIPPLKRRPPPQRLAASKTTTPAPPATEAPQANPPAAVAALEPASSKAQPGGAVAAPPQVAASAGGANPAVTAATAAAHGGTGTGIFLQLGAFTTAANAESFRKFVGAELTSLADQLQVLLLDGRFRLHAGPFSSESDARSMASQIARELRFKPFLITR